MLLEELFNNDDGNKSLLTHQGTQKWRNEKDFFKKWFSLPYLTGKKKTVKESNSSFDRYYFDTFKSLNGIVDVFKNLPPGMIRSFQNQTGLKEIRGIIFGNDRYYWDATNALHYEVHSHLLKKIGEKKFYTFTIHRKSIYAKSPSFPYDYFLDLEELGYKIPQHAEMYENFNETSAFNNI